MKDARLDQKDHVILAALKKNARKTIAELSHELQIPRATVHERIMKLKRSGIIQKFTIAQDYSRTGLPAMSFVFAASDSSADTHSIAKKISSLPEVQGTYLVSGEWDILIKIRGKSIEEVGTSTVEKIKKTKGISRILTVACFESLKDEI